MAVLLVDYRCGSKDLIAPLKKMGLPAEEANLNYGDIAFEGRGAGGDVLDIGIEFKNLESGDATSSIRTGRLSGTQLPGLTGKDAIYDYAYLMVEGEWRVNNVGRILKRTKKGWRPLPGGMTLSEFQKKLFTMEVCTGLRTVYTQTRSQSLHYIANLYRWFTDKAVDQHTSHLTPHNRPMGYLKLSDFREAVMKWPGVGLAVSKAAESEFMTSSGEASVTLASSASVDTWAGLVTTDRQGRTRRFGIPAAQRVYNFCRGIK